MDFNVKSSNFQGFLLVSYARFRKISYLCPRIKAFFVYCKIQKRAEVRSFPYCYLYNICLLYTSHDMQLKRSTYEVLQILSISLTDKTHLRDLFDKTIFNDVKELDYSLFKGLMS